MPLKLAVSTSRKVGEPNFGSRGATVGLEMEVDTSLADQPRQLHERIRRLFRLAKQSVDQELGCAAESASQTTPELTRPATQRQLRAIQAIASRRSINIADELQRQFGVGRLEDLSLRDASRLIATIEAPDTAVAQRNDSEEPLVG